MYYTNNIPQQSVYGCQLLYTYNPQNSYLKYSYQNSENVYYNVPSYDTSNKLNINIPDTVKPRSKTWDKIKSLTTASKKSKSYKHVSQNFVNIPRYSAENTGMNYVSSYFCPQSQYHIHSKHNQVSMHDKLYLHKNQPIYQRPVYKYKKNISKTTDKLNYRSYEHYKDTNSSIQLKPNLSIKPRPSRSRSSKQLNKIIQPSNSKISNMFGSNETINTGQSIVQPTTPSIPPPPPINEEIFKSAKNLVFKKKSGCVLPDQTEKSFNAVVNELKSRLSAIKISKELTHIQDQNVKESSTFNTMPILNKVTQIDKPDKGIQNTENENLLKILQAGKSNLKHVTQSTSLITEKKSIPVVTKSTNAIFTSSTPFELYDNNESNEAKSKEVTVDWFNSTLNSVIQPKPEIRNFASFSSSTSSSSTSSTSSIVSSSASEKTTSIRHTLNNRGSQYKLEIYNEINDMSDDYTNITRLMLSPKPSSDILPVKSTPKFELPPEIQKQSSNSLFAEQQNSKKIAAFCTNNLFRDSKKLKSNYIRIAESFNSSAGFENFQSVDEIDHNFALTSRTQASNTSSSLSHSQNEFTSISKSFDDNKYNKETESNMNQSNFNNIIPTKTASIPSKFSSFNVYNQISMQMSRSQDSGTRAEDQEQPCIELNKSHNKKIDEYLNEMSRYYHNLQTNTQYRS